MVHDVWIAIVHFLNQENEAADSRHYQRRMAVRSQRQAEDAGEEIGKLFGLHPPIFLRTPVLSSANLRLPALPVHFVKEHRRRRADVQRVHLVRHRDSYGLVAGG